MAGGQLHFEQLDDLQASEAPEVSAALEALAGASLAEARGAVFTRAEVVNFILDLVGYTPDRPLHTLRILEPSFGAGDFLLPIVQRLLAALAHSRRPTTRSAARPA